MRTRGASRAIPRAIPLAAVAVVILIAGVVAVLVDDDDDEVVADTATSSTSSTSSTTPATTTSRPPTTATTTPTTVVATTTTLRAAARPSSTSSTSSTSTSTTETTAPPTTVPGATTTTTTPAPIPAGHLRLSYRNDTTVTAEARVTFEAVDQRVALDPATGTVPVDVRRDGSTAESYAVRVGGMLCSGSPAEMLLSAGREYRIVMVSLDAAEAPTAPRACDGDREVFLRVDDVAAGTSTIVFEG